MKKTMKLWAFALLAVAGTVAGCSDKMDEPVAKDSTRTIKVAASVSLENDAAVASKANWEDGKGLQWESSDATKLGLIDNKGTVNASTDLTIATDGTAVFTGEVNSEATKFLASYPKVNAGVNDGCSTIYFNIAPAQTQAAAGEMDGADGKVAMVGKAPIELSGEVSEYSASMRMISSLARFLVYSSNGKTDKVKSVSVASDVVISGARVAIVNWSNEGNYEFNGGEVSKAATVTLSEQFDLSGVTSKDNTKGIYLGLIPATSKTTTYTVTTDKGAYTFTPSSDVEFKAGTIHNIPLNLDNGTFASTENEVIFTTQVTGNQTAAQNVDAQAHTLLLGVTTATCGGEAVTMNADDCKLVVAGDEGADLSWVTADWENTNNYNFRITIAKNTTTSERAAKVYMEYKGTRSKNWINVHQDAGTGEAENPDSGDGGEGGDSGDSGETGEHTFSYTLFNNAADKSTGTGFGSAAGSVGDWYRFENVTIDGKTYTAGTEMENLAQSDLGQEMLNYAFSFLELESTDVQVPGTDPLTTVEEMKQFVTLQIWGSGAAIYVRIVLTQNTTGARRTFKLQTKDGSGNVLSTIVYFQNI